MKVSNEHIGFRVDIGLLFSQTRTAILQTKGLLPIPKNPTTVTTTTAEPTTEPISPSHNNTTSSDGAIVVAKPPGAD